MPLMFLILLYLVDMPKFTHSLQWNINIMQIIFNNEHLKQALD